MTAAFAHGTSHSRQDPLNNAILSTLAYSDIFDYPLRFEELHYFLVAKTSAGELLSGLNAMNGNLANLKGFYFLSGREAIVELRLKREARLRNWFNRAVLYGRIIGYLPFVRMVGLTGSLALRNSNAKPDFDYFLIVEEGRVWTARLLTLALNRITRIFGDVLCPNILISGKVLEWPQKNIYTAREIAQMIVISGWQAYLEFRKANHWMAAYLPNSMIDGLDSNQQYHHTPISFMDRIKQFVENILSRKLGDKFELWEYNRKHKRLIMQSGSSLEFGFDVDRCWGNLHNHGAETLAKYNQKVSSLLSD